MNTSMPQLIYALSRSSQVTPSRPVPPHSSLQPCTTWRQDLSKSQKPTAGNVGTQRACEKAGPVSVCGCISLVLRSKPQQKKLSSKLEFCWKRLIEILL